MHASVFRLSLAIVDSTRSIICYVMAPTNRLFVMTCRSMQLIIFSGNSHFSKLRSYFNMLGKLISYTIFHKHICIAVMSSSSMDLGSIPGAAMLEEGFFLATSALHLITVVPACLFGLT